MPAVERGKWQLSRDRYRKRSKTIFDFSKNTNPNIGTVEDNIMKAARGRVDLRRFKALTLEDILKTENSYNISYLN